jgi:dienelactone hydrolase
MRTVQKSFGLEARGLRGGVACYPGCAPSFNAGIDVPVLILIGGKDDWTSADACRRLKPGGPSSSRSSTTPAPIAFDVRARDRPVPGAPGKMHHLVYDPVAASDAESRTGSFSTSC